MSQPTKAIDSKLMKDFKEYLTTFNSASALEKFNLSKFNGSSEDERKQCISALVNFAIEHPACAEKLTKFAQTFVSFGIKDVPKIFTEFCDEKLKIITNDKKNWIEIECFGLFLAHMYINKTLKARLIYGWLNEVMKCSAENDEALKVFIDIFKLVSDVMKNTNMSKFMAYLEELHEYKMKDNSRIPNNCKKWMIKELRAAKQAEDGTCEAPNNKSSPNLKSTTDAANKNDDEITTNQNPSSLIDEFNEGLKPSALKPYVSKIYEDNGKLDAEFR